MEVAVKYCESEDGIQYNTTQDIINVVSYITNPEATFGMIGTIGISLENYLSEMVMLKEAYDQIVDRQVVHLIVSSKEFRFLDYNEMMRSAFEIGMFYGIEHQVIFGIHHYRKGTPSPKNMHIHYIINSINYMNGKYLFPDTYRQRLFKRHVMELYKRYGLQEYYDIYHSFG